MLANTYSIACAFRLLPTKNYLADQRNTILSAAIKRLNEVAHKMEQTYHRPVLLDQTIEALGIRPDGIYLDGTAGGGGHSHAIASATSGGPTTSQYIV